MKAKQVTDYYGIKYVISQEKSIHQTSKWIRRLLRFETHEVLRYTFLSTLLIGTATITYTFITRILEINIP